MSKTHVVVVVYDGKGQTSRVFDATTHMLLLLLLLLLLELLFAILMAVSSIQASVIAVTP